MFNFVTLKLAGIKKKIKKEILSKNGCSKMERNFLSQVKKNWGKLFIRKSGGWIIGNKKCKDKIKWRK